MLSQYLTRARQRQIVVSVMVIQLLFLVAQVSIFYPCLVGTPHKLYESAQSMFTLSTDYDESHVSNSNDGPAAGLDNFYQPTWESLETRPIPEWYEDAKLGIFLHWGVFSVPSFVGTDTEGLAEWFWYYWKSGIVHERYHTQPAIDSVRKYMQENYPPNFKYTDFASMFTAEFFDPVKWAELFKASGARYVVLTSKHHDGFTLWESQRSWNWNSVSMGPHRDIVGDLGKAIREKTDLHYGLYHSLFEWYHPMYLRDKENNYTTQHYVRDKLMPELHDLVTTYKPDIVWSDGDWEAHSDYWNSTHFIAWLYNQSPVKKTVVTNDRWGTDCDCQRTGGHGGYLTCADRYNAGESKKKMTRKWENCMTLDRESWGYRRNAKLVDYYDMDSLLKMFAQTVSYGGNMLMNVGPTADGRISPIFEERLRQVGMWLRVNGEGIYHTRMWEFQEDPITDNVYYTKKTVEDETNVFAILLEWPENDILHLGAPVPSERTVVNWLGYRNDIQWEKHETSGIILRLPVISLAEQPCEWAWVFKFQHLENATPRHPQASGI